MKFSDTNCGSRLLATSLLAVATVLGHTIATAQVLEEIVVTAQKREVGLQSAPIAISALTGEDLARSRIFSVDDLAASVSSLALTGGNSPVDLELNIRGITNTRLDSPSGEAAVGTFVDEIYIGRNGGMNTDFYDIERVEVIRGPQGVLLGKSVVGGALSIITAKPEFEGSGSVTIGAGNYESRLVSGYVTGGFSDTLAGRFSFQGRRNDGYAKDVLHDRRLDDLDSIQFRAQLLYQPQEGGWSSRLVVDHNQDKSNGINVVAVSDGQTGGFRPRPWSQMRAFLGLTDPYESVPEATLYHGNNTPVDQYLDRESTGLMLNVEKDFEGFALTFHHRLSRCPRRQPLRSDRRRPGYLRRPRYSWRHLCRLPGIQPGCGDLFLLRTGERRGGHQCLQPGGASGVHQRRALRLACGPLLQAR